MLILYALLPDVSQGARNVGVLTTILLFPSSHAPALSVAWTLVHEILFYFVFAVFFFSRRMFVTLVFVWVFSIVVVLFSGAQLDRFESYFLSPLNLCFVLGMATYAVSRHIFLSDSAAVMVFIAGVCGAVFQAVSEFPDRAAIAFSFGAMVLGSIFLRVKLGRLAWPIYSLGGASYSIYLVHNPVLSMASRVWAGVGLSQSALVGFSIVALVALMAGFLYWVAYERVALAFVRSRFQVRHSK